MADFKNVWSTQELNTSKVNSLIKMTSEYKQIILKVDSQIALKTDSRFDPPEDKTSQTLHFLPVSICIISNTNDSSTSWGCRIRRTSIHWCWEYTLIQLHVISTVVLHEDKNCSTLMSKYITLGNIPKGCFIPTQRHLTNHVHCCSILIY